ncbi:hypothetical protein [Kozakia baliensis]|uniref:hypothetical protein n=1 Tax=Kozakia baliensis TaxID=153496 RepID=UPI0013632618|nr:hypothetical protein [Kozakia baliensis]
MIETPSIRSSPSIMRPCIFFVSGTEFSVPSQVGCLPSEDQQERNRKKERQDVSAFSKFRKNFSMNAAVNYRRGEHILFDDHVRYEVSFPSPTDPAVKAAYAEIARTNNGPVPHPDFKGWWVCLDYVRVAGGIEDGAVAMRIHYGRDNLANPTLLGTLCWREEWQEKTYGVAMALHGFGVLTGKIAIPDVPAAPLLPKTIPALTTFLSLETGHLTSAQTKALPRMLYEMCGALMDEVPHLCGVVLPPLPPIPLAPVKNDLH